MKIIFKISVVIFLLNIFICLSAFCNIIGKFFLYITNIKLTVEDIFFWSVILLFVSGFSIYHTIGYKKSLKRKWDIT